MNKTKIEWVKNPDGTQGYTWNPITGCLNSCPYCYARRLANGQLKQRYLANPQTAVKWQPEASIEEYEHQRTNPFYPRFWEERLYEPVNKTRRWGRQTQVVHTQEPKGIFVCDMSDLFGIGIPEEWTRRVLDRFQYCSQHRFYLLTKQPQNLVKSSPFPENCWVGVTATDADMAAEGIACLRQIVAKIKFMSFEPLLNRIPIHRFYFGIGALDWLIIGAQTNPTVMPKIEWVEEIVEAADKAGIPVFLKDNLTYITSGKTWAGKWMKHENQPKGEEFWWHPRQEMPKESR